MMVIRREASAFQAQRMSLSCAGWRVFNPRIQRETPMQVRFQCPACKQSHVLDMPESTIHMTCSQTGKLLELVLGISGEVKPRILEGDDSRDKKKQTT
ncbi:MAG: hypothetical protein MI923_01555 [Phycisphaerales bacterium]|nr:hypothetical protein [Phycisphaerales bacterium]